MTILGPELERMVDDAIAAEKVRPVTDTYRGQRSRAVWEGSLPDAVPTNTLPQLRYGYDRLPRTCQHCGARALEVEPPNMYAIVGRVTCFLCSRQSCWLLPALPPITPDPPKQTTWSPSGRSCCCACGRSDRPHRSHDRCWTCATYYRRNGRDREVMS